MNFKVGFRTAGNTNEQVVFAGRCILFGIYPEKTTGGTITLRDSATAAGATAFSVSAIGLTQAGKEFGGIVCNLGLTIQLSDATDLTTVVYVPF